jgi:inosine-uridine nucleoside N-ribohydrolase
MRYVIFLSLLFYALSVVAKTPVLIDTDLGPDDVQAIVYLLSQPSIKVEAITIAGDGEVHCQPGLHYLSNLLHYLGHSTIPIACGPKKPLSGDRQFPNIWRIQANHFFYVSIPKVTVSKNTRSQFAPNLIKKILINSPQPVAFIELAPATNIAYLIQRNPKLVKDKIFVSYITGFKLPLSIKKYNINFGSHGTFSWNTWVDPKAASILLHSGIKQYYATDNVLLRLYTTYTKYWKKPLSPEQWIITKIVNSPGEHNQFVGDQFTAAWFMHPTLCYPLPVKMDVRLVPPNVGLSAIVHTGVQVYPCVKANGRLFVHFFNAGLSNPLFN